MMRYFISGDFFFGSGAGAGVSVFAGFSFAISHLVTKSCTDRRGGRNINDGDGMWGKRTGTIALRQGRAARLGKARRRPFSLPLELRDFVQKLVNDRDHTRRCLKTSLSDNHLRKLFCHVHRAKFQVPGIDLVDISVVNTDQRIT